MTNLLLIESPGKLRKLSQILGQGWIVKASMGHVRELASDGEDALGFDLKGDRIECRYEPRGSRGKQVLQDLKQAVKQASHVYIATDPDREGETIGWHLKEALKLKNPYRVTYSEITPQAVRAAIAKPKHLNQDLIDAGRARDCLDKLVGYKGSKHVVWKLNNGAKSMGRVQSATLHLLCQREQEILAFTPQTYWSVWVDYVEGFKAFYRSPKAAKPTAKATAKPTTPDGDKPQPSDAGDEKSAPESDRVTSKAEADRLVKIAKTHPHKVLSLEGKNTTQSPPPPFITSSLQQVAGAKLKFSPDKTMKVAQSLYESGHITYMRTDSVMLSASFCQAVQAYLQSHDPENLPKKVTSHRSNKGAQEAHEAIRPTEVNHVPDSLNISGDEAKLYNLIWNRTLASQCAPAQLRKTRILTQAGEAPNETQWEARGQILTFPGYTKYWNNLSADSQLPALTVNQPLKLKAADSEEKQTSPPPRYSEPKLVQLMERKGIGRPSTYAPTLKTLKERTYIDVLKGNLLQPTPLGMALDNALANLLPDLIEPDFTARMEADLDRIAEGDHNWEKYLTHWHQSYFQPALDRAKQAISSRAIPTYQIPSSGVQTGAQTGVQTGQTGAHGAKPTAFNQPLELTRFKCPKCQQKMGKVPSKSEKLKANHFLKCPDLACAAVMFWNPKAKKYEPPYSDRPVDPNSLTDHPCPVCGALLERYTYTKEGKSKIMLRCSILDNRKTKCREVAFFEGREGFWSPKFGTIELGSVTKAAAKTAAKTVAKTAAKTAKATKR
jgi:DNA topoisomerase I